MARFNGQTKPEEDLMNESLVKNMIVSRSQRDPVEMNDREKMIKMKEEEIEANMKDMENTNNAIIEEIKRKRLNQRQAKVEEMESKREQIIIKAQ